MKKIYTAIILLIGAAGSAFSQTQPTPELLYYKFDGSGTSVPNLASSPPAGTLTATLMGSLTQGPSGQCGGAVIGSGNASSTDYVNTNWATNLTGTSWTISMYTKDITASSTLFYIFGDANAGSFRCFTNGVAGPNNWVLRGTGITDTYINGGATVAPHLTTFVYNMTTNTIYGYLDGVLVTTVVQASSPVINGTGPFKVIGYATNVGAPSGGKLDEFRVYNRALTAAEVATLMYPNTTSTATVTACTSYVSPAGYTRTSSGTYQDTIPNSGGCDSIITTNLTIVYPSSSSISATACSSYTAPSGAMFTASGTYHDTIPNMNGCDSVITINLTVRQPSTASINPVACSMYVAPSGAMYMASGMYMDTIPNAVGCDSVITINLTVNQPSSSTIAPAVCSSYLSPAGNTYTTSGTYTDVIPNAVGCDSVITINLIVNQPSSASFNASACSVYTAPSGAMYTASGTYMDTIPNAAGCDSVMTITVSINNTFSSINASACTNYTAPSGAMYTASGTYMDTIPNAMGCDSIMMISLTIFGNPSVTGSASSTTVCVNDGNVALTGSPVGGTWVGTGVSGSSFVPLNAGTGTFPVTYTYTDGNGCSAAAGTTITVNACIGVEELSLLNAVNVYPNPNNGVFTIAVNADVNDMLIVIMDLQGRTVYSSAGEKIIAGFTKQVNLESEAAGLYLMQISGNGETRTEKISVQR